MMKYYSTVLLLSFLLLQHAIVVHTQGDNVVSAQDTQAITQTGIQATATTPAVQAATTTAAAAITTTATQQVVQTTEATTAAPVIITTTTVAPVVVITTTPPPPAIAITTTTDETQFTETTTVDQQQQTVAPTTTTIDQQVTDTLNNNNQPTQTNNSNNNNQQQIPNTNGASATSSQKPSQAGSEKKDGDNGAPNNKTATIAGSAVGGFVGLAIIAGVLTWLNRRGGCTSRTRRRDIPTDFDSMPESNKEELYSPSADHMPSSPFQRRFVPPTTGYMTLNDEEYAYGQQQQQQQQDFYNQQPLYAPSPTLSARQYKPDHVVVEQKPNIV